MAVRELWRRDWDKATSVDAVSSVGTMPVEKFQERYKDNLPIDRIVFTGLAPSPVGPDGVTAAPGPDDELQLTATKPQLVAKMVELVNERL